MNLLPITSTKSQRKRSKQVILFVRLRKMIATSFSVHQILKSSNSWSAFTIRMEFRMKRISYFHILG
jgi:hypothetical protein